MELGIYTFVERSRDPFDGSVRSEQQRMHELLEEMVLADQLGLDVFAVAPADRKH